MPLLSVSSRRCQVWLAQWLLLAIAICLASASRRKKHDDDDDDDDDDDSKTFWDHVGGIVVIGVISVVGAAMFSCLAWVVCSCHERCSRRRGVSVLTVRASKNAFTSSPPEWSRSLTVQPELSFGFGQMSGGFYSLSNVQLMRQRPGADVTDGAKWQIPMYTGKHLFEVIWPWGCRGYKATVGVATKDAPLKCQGGNLVGGNAHSWGLDIVGRKTMHNNKTLHCCPTDGSYVPDRFLMYVNMDEGTIGFGCDVTFWGNVITDLPPGKSLYPMIGANKWDANVQLFYRGSAATSGFDPFTGSGQAYTLPPLTGPLPPTYGDIFMVGPAKQDATPGRPRSAWEPMPPPTPPPPASAPLDLPPAYTSPTPPGE